MSDTCHHDLHGGQLLHHLAYTRKVQAFYCICWVWKPSLRVCAHMCFHSTFQQGKRRSCSSIPHPSFLLSRISCLLPQRAIHHSLLGRHQFSFAYKFSSNSLIYCQWSDILGGGILDNSWAPHSWQAWVPSWVENWIPLQKHLGVGSPALELLVGRGAHWDLENCTWLFCTTLQAPSLLLHVLKLQVLV